jgi:capsular polysaccharide biosynthesis protein
VSDGTPRLRPSPLTAVAQRPFLSVVVVLCFLAAGLAFGASRPVEHTAEARLVVGQLDVTAQAVPGFALATQQLAVTYSRLLASDRVREDVSAALQGRTDGLLGFTASPIPESAIIRVEARALTPELAVAAADNAAGALVGQVRRLQSADPGATLLQDYVKARAQAEAAEAEVVGLTRQVDAAGAASRPGLEARLRDARIARDGAQLQAEVLRERYAQVFSGVSGAPLLSVSVAVLTTNSRSSTIQLYGLAGLAAGLLAALLLAVALSWRKARRAARAPAA